MASVATLRVPRVGQPKRNATVQQRDEARREPRASELAGAFDIGAQALGEAFGQFGRLGERFDFVKLCAGPSRTVGFRESAYFGPT